MSDYFFSGESKTGEKLFIAPITSDVAAAHNIADSESIGYFLYQKPAGTHNADVCILAKLPSEDAAFELGRLLGLS
ncbi:hypothetical protein FJW08_12385 [Mesorhizobium sp. B3-2-1]|uniref:hypothetical protein n=1 Tax=Mesorhizobium sp. B3-2-1 TaxID=2589891 RepID=UPI00112A93D5|nr:hypothetical protein [Mesorhizobium sp. B3-2-1]TPI30913.1 hypothetical protein FJW08_12385 [Mesorhizobium sp. B3-2-1]